MKKLTGIIFAVAYLAMCWALGVFAYSAPTTAPTTNPVYLQGWIDAGGQVAKPIIIPTASPVLAPLQRWAAQVRVAAGPYVADGADLTPIIQSAKSGTIISCAPRGKFRLGATTTIPAGVRVFLNGSDLTCEVTPGSNSNIALLAGATFDGAHVTHAATLFVPRGKPATITNVYTDDYAPGATSATWSGVQTRFCDSELVDVDPNTVTLVVSGCWIGLTQSQQIYVTNNFDLEDDYFGGSLNEYDLRTEVTGPTNTNRCQRGTAKNCTFRYNPHSGKGSSIGVRMGDGITFIDCYIESNLRIGQQPAAAPWPADAKAYTNGISLVGCKFISMGQREAITSLNGATVNITDCEFWTDANPISIAIAPTWNITTVTGCTVHVPPKGPWHRLTNQDAVPGTGTTISAAPYAVPAVLAPF